MYLLALKHLLLQEHDINRYILCLSFVFMHLSRDIYCAKYYGQGGGGGVAWEKFKQKKERKRKENYLKRGKRP